MSSSVQARGASSSGEERFCREEIVHEKEVGSFLSEDLIQSFDDLQSKLVTFHIAGGFFIAKCIQTFCFFA